MAMCGIAGVARADLTPPVDPAALERYRRTFLWRTPEVRVVGSSGKTPRVVPLRSAIRAVVLFSTLAVSGLQTQAAPRIVLRPVLTGLADPLYVTHARDGGSRLFVVEQAGRIKVLSPGAAAPTVFLDITSRVLTGGERGLLGLAFHPRYATNGRLFVNYTRRPDGATVIAEYRVSAADPGVAEIDERPILVIPQPFSNHNGGMVEFGPDGFLYIGMGDGGGAFDPDNRAQDPTDLLGKILRIDVDAPAGPSAAYSSPPDNPFANGHPGRDEIFALGFRNPWRFSFDRATGELHVGDVGQKAREEIDRVTLGGNYGWRILEGTQCTGLDPEQCGDATLIPPVTEYGHTGGRCSVTGGYAYRGNAGTLPAGAYVFGDFCSGEIFRLEDGVRSRLLATDHAIASFGEDEAGELYVVGLGGTVHRLINPDAPALTLGLNQKTVRPGATLRVSVGARTAGAPVVADAYVGIVGPDGRTVLFLTSLNPLAGFLASLTGDARTFPPVVRGLVIPAGTNVTLDDFLVVTLTGLEKPGTYVLFAALARRAFFADGRVDPGDLLAITLETIVVVP
jgi:glucose/arabinose dehydrogenase